MSEAITEEMIDAALSHMGQWVRKAERERHPKAFRDDMRKALEAAIILRQSHESLA